MATENALHKQTPSRQAVALASVRNDRFNNLKSRVHISRAITVRALLMRAYVVMYLPGPRLGAEPFQNVISFGTIKEPTALIPTGILAERWNTIPA